MTNRRHLLQLAAVAAVAAAGGAAWVSYGPHSTRGPATGPPKNYPMDPFTPGHFRQKLLMPGAGAEPDTGHNRLAHRHSGKAVRRRQQAAVKAQRLRIHDGLARRHHAVQAHTQCRALNAIKSQFSRGFAWALANSQWVLGTASPMETIEALDRYTLAPVAGRIKADVLILAGADDHFIPLNQAADFARRLTAACSVQRAADCLRAGFRWRRTLPSGRAVAMAR